METGTRITILGDIHQTAPAIVDIDMRQLRKDAGQAFAQDGAALGVGTLVRCCGKTRPATENQPVIRRKTPVIADIHAIDAGAVARHRRGNFLVGQRSRGNDETADSHDAPAEITEIRRRIGTARHQHVVGGHGAFCRLEYAAATRLRNIGDGGLLDDDGAAPLCRLGEADDVTPHMHHAALLRQHGAMERRADLALQITGRQQGRIRIDFRMNSLEILRKPFEMLRLRGKLELAGAAEIAVYAFLGDDRFQRVDGSVQRLVEGDRPLLAELLLGREVAVGEAIVEMTTVAAGSAETDRFRLQNDHLGAGHGELPCRAKPGKAAADHGNIVMTFDCAFDGARKPGRRIMPVGDVFHRLSPFR